MADTPPTKPIHTIVLDAAPLIRNVPPISTLLAQSHALITTPAVISEIRDPAARSRIETLYLPFLTQRTPKPESIKFVGEFARKTGDRAVLSRQDLEILALAYEVECERNGGDWRLRREPGQKGINGMPPVKATEGETREGEADGEAVGDEPIVEQQCKVQNSIEDVTKDLAESTIAEKRGEAQENSASAADGPEETQPEEDSAQYTTETQIDESDDDDDDDDEEGWITPSNIKKRQEKDAAAAAASVETKTMQVATITGDFAMQNVLLRMNLNLLSPNNMQRIRRLNSYILRCHGCFATTKEMDKQFCPRCGKPTLTRVSCSTSAGGAFRLHLKKNKQWNTRGDRYSIPKPTAGTSNGKWKGGGGAAGWGTNLILAEDQKEYVRAVAEEGRRTRKERDLMDDDFLPAIVTGERMKGGGRIKVGAGRAVNSRKRR
ncbi:RNA-binding protein NOB1 [Blastomyces parvus]|uniref:20S-pre-rRNA D-site endonuclease NOB1 n=1 Tax=Blastomyces parvus TaxID=2060905 RepID=A0A2B7XEH5_9EURO|nr:RNA-binding protein NOB1 [Blastomyces parvus]